VTLFEASSRSSVLFEFVIVRLAQYHRFMQLAVDDIDGLESRTA
jgi:hypothetical protein